MLEKSQPHEIEMDWSPQQLKGLGLIQAWLMGERQVFYLAGYAGTGKSTLANYIAKHSGMKVVFVAPTGKAANVLCKKGCAAITIHEYLYKYQGSNKDVISKILAERRAAMAAGNAALIEELTTQLNAAKEERENLYFESKEVSAEKGVLIIVDEASMVSVEIGEDLCKTGAKILGLGDQGQLPPVGAKAFFAQNEPDYELTEIHRQAKDSAIITIAESIRGGRLHYDGMHGKFLDDAKTQAEAEFWPKRNWTWPYVLTFDKIITGMNNTRFKINEGVRRELFGRGSLLMPSPDVLHLPVVGDKIICTKNDKRLGLINGGEGVITGIGEIAETYFCANILYEDKKLNGVLISRFHFEEAKLAGKSKKLTKQEFEDQAEIPDGERVLYFDFGYCITGHKSQGSQWDNVLIADDNFLVSNPKERIKWLYTSFTRAAKRVVVLYGN